VKFRKASTAALCMETLNDESQHESQRIRVVIAEPKMRRELFPYPPSIYHPPSIPFNFNPYVGYNPPTPTADLAQAKNRLYVVVDRAITQEQLSNLFSRFPGMEYCDLKRDKDTGESKGFAFISYSSPQVAQMARDQLDGVEFPTGRVMKVVIAEPPGARPPEHPVDPNHPEGSRLFLVLQGNPIPEYVLYDVFASLGGLEYVRMQRDRPKCGYVKFTTAVAAQYALRWFDGSDVAGTKLKLQIAVPPSESRKRQKTT